MKEIDNEKFYRRLHGIRLNFGIVYYGHSNNMTMGVTIDDKKSMPDKMTDEEIIILHQLLMRAGEALVDEMERRDMVPDYLKRLYDETRPTPQAEA